MLIKGRVESFSTFEREKPFGELFSGACANSAQQTSVPLTYRGRRSPTTQFDATSLFIRRPLAVPRRKERNYNYCKMAGLSPDHVRLSPLTQLSNVELFREAKKRSGTRGSDLAARLRLSRTFQKLRDMPETAMRRKAEAPPPPRHMTASNGSRTSGPLARVFQERGYFCLGLLPPACHV